ncbi:YciI family protein [Chloroflexota bacterium]
MASFVVTVQLSEKFREGYFKAIKDSQAGGDFVLPADITQSRESHNEYLEGLKAEGKLYCAGNFNDFSGALFIFEGASEEEVHRIMQQEPHNQNGFFTNLEVKEWTHRF